jgi:hypothetical protein
VSAIFFSDARCFLEQTENGLARVVELISVARASAVRIYLGLAVNGRVAHFHSGLQRQGSNASHPARDDDRSNGACSSAAQELKYLRREIS